MPRMHPPQGYITAAKARERLNVSDTFLRKYVIDGKLKRYGPTSRSHKPWYKYDEVEALYQSLQTLEEFDIKTTRKSSATLEDAVERISLAYQWKLSDVQALDNVLGIWVARATPTNNVEKVESSDSSFLIMVKTDFDSGHDEVSFLSLEYLLNLAEWAVRQEQVNALTSLLKDATLGGER